jgi:hypothetical protein
MLLAASSQCHAISTGLAASRVQHHKMRKVCVRLVATMLFFVSDLLLLHKGLDRLAANFMQILSVKSCHSVLEKLVFS